MSKTTVVFFKNEKGKEPVREWFKAQKPAARKKGMKTVNLLAENGHELRRPFSDILRDDIYELRWALNHVQYRILYFFHKQNAVVLAHAITKEDVVPNAEINRALENKKKYEANPKDCTGTEEVADDF